MRAGAVFAAARVEVLLATRLIVVRVEVGVDVVVVVLVSVVVVVAGTVSVDGVVGALTAESGAVVVGCASCPKAAVDERARVAAIAMVALEHA